MEAILLITLLFFLHESQCEVRTYNIAAVEIKWDYAPSGINKLNGKQLDDDE